MFCNLKENSKISKGHYVLWEQKSWWSPTWLNIENHDQLAKWHQNLESRIQNQYLDIYFVRPYLDFCFILKMKKIKGLKWSIDNPPTELPRCHYYFGPLHFRTRSRPLKWKIGFSSEKAELIFPHWHSFGDIKQI